MVGGWGGGRVGFRGPGLRVPPVKPPPKISMLILGPVELEGGATGCCCCAAAIISGWLGNGLKPVMSGWLFMTSLRLMFTGIGRVVAPAGTSSICPARTLRKSPGFERRAIRELPSRVINLLLVPPPDSKMTVVPVIATLTALVLIDPPPESLGTRRRIEPLSTLAVRPPPVKLKIVFEPSRVMVRSGNVNSERDSPPVRTPVSSETLSFTAAGRAAAWEGRSLTSRTIWVTRASFAAAVAVGLGTRRNTRPSAELARILEVVFMGRVGFAEFLSMRKSRSGVEPQTGAPSAGSCSQFSSGPMVLGEDQEQEEE